MLNTIFNTKLLQNELDQFDVRTIPNYKQSLKLLHDWKMSIETSDINKTKEKSIQGRFFQDFFVKILGYKDRIGNSEWSFMQEERTLMDGSTPDGVLGNFTPSIRDIKVVIELKDGKTDLDKKQNRSNKVTPVEQAFSYAPKCGEGCKWVIVSNFKTIRLYHSNNQMEYEEFDVTKLHIAEEFKKFYYLLNSQNLISKSQKSIIDTLYENNLSAKNNITNEFYKLYKDIRINLFKSIKTHNSSIDEVTLFTKTQKLMDRFIFICFCEGNSLLEKGIFESVLKIANMGFEMDNNRIWRQLKGLFNSIDKGNPARNINHFNGGLFAEDSILDGLNIPDDLFSGLEELSKYDFATDLNVNILGHIFEQSISDIEDIKKEIAGIEDGKGKRKRDGIFYTPDYITNYIVEQTIGRWLQEKRTSLGELDLKEIPDQEPVMPLQGARTNKQFKASKDYKEYKKKYNEYIEIKESHVKFYQAYNYILQQITIIDYTCGSGAFLNAAFDYLYKEGKRVNDILIDISGTSDLLKLDKKILKDNLYGVDINPESVEITKLSLWLKTANKYDSLTSLDDNIICANSLIEDSEIAKDKAINWRKKFKDVFDNGGFDIVIGNPPYGAKLTDEEKNYLDTAYTTTQYNYDTYKFFLELAFKITKEGAYVGLITPNTYFVLEKSNLIREFLFNNYTLKNLVEVFNVFPDAVVEPIISIYKNEQPFYNDKFEVILLPRKTKLDNNFINIGIKTEFKQKDLKIRKGYLFNYHETEFNKKLYNKIQSASKPLNEYLNVTTGVKPYQTNKGIPKQTKEIVKSKPYNGYEKLDETWKPYMKGENIDKYMDKWSGEYIKYGEWLAEPRKPEIFTNEKLFIRQTSDRLVATFDDKEKVCKNTLHCIYKRIDKPDINLKYVLGLINSKLLNWVFQYENFHIVGKPLAETKVIYVERLPIIYIEENNQFVEIVNKLLNMNQECFEKIKEFNEFIELTYKPKKLSEKLRDFYEYDYETFISELKKQKVKLTETTKFELMSLFRSKSKEIIKRKKEILLLSNSLDKLIYNLYDLSEEEISYIEENQK